MNVKLHNLSRALVKKFNNFKLTSTIAGGFALLAGALSLASLFLYHFAGDVNSRNFRRVGFYQKPVLGMLFFFGILAILIISICVIYLGLPAMRNKEKNVPHKGILLASFISAVVQLLILVLSIVLIATEEPNTKVGLIVCMPFQVIALVGSGFCLFPYIKCSFYLPEIQQKK